MSDELVYDSRPELERPVLIAAFRGWNDGGQGASLAGAYLARAWAAREFATIDPGELLRLPGDAADRVARRRRDAPDRLAGEQFPARAASRRRARRDHHARASSRTCAGARSRELVTGVALAASRRARADARLAARRRAAHALGAGHRQRDRSEPDRRARAAAVALRGADGHRRRAARRVLARRPEVREPLGRGAALRVADPVAAGREGTRRPARRRCSVPTSTRAELDEAADVVHPAGERGGRDRRGDLRVRAGARAARRRARRRGRASRRATRSRPS